MRTPPPLADHHALFLDIDGTLIEIALEPEQVSVPIQLVDLLARCRAKLDGALALVTGRRIADIDRLFPDLAIDAAGQHGIEQRRADGSVEAPPAPPWLADLHEKARAFAAARPGLLFEPKRFGAGIHYRKAPEHAEDVVRFFEAARARIGEQALIQPGKMVLELRLAGIDKGVALVRLMETPPYRGRVPIALGDDVTDEAMFLRAARLDGFGVKIGAGESAAAFRLDDVAAVRRWLAGES